MNSREFEQFARQSYKQTGLLFGKYKFNTIPGEEAVSEWIRKDGYWESYVSSQVWKVFEHFKPKVCVDIGANVGYYSFLYHYLGAEKVFAFEPVPENYSVLLGNIVQNHLEDSIYAYREAVTDSSGETVIYTDNGLPNSHIFGGENGILVQTVSLDEFFDGINLIRSTPIIPDFLKIDAEGSEYKIIMGAKRLLELSSLKAIHVEMALDRGYDINELFNFISQYFPYSYDMLSGSSGGVAVQTRSFMDILFTKSFHNFLQ